jgi:hypothetical protein
MASAILFVPPVLRLALRIDRLSTFLRGKWERDGGGDGNDRVDPEGCIPRVE